MLYEPNGLDKKQYSKMSVCILSPMMHIEPKWVQSMANMIAYSWMHGLRIYTFAYIHRTVVDWARNDLAKEAMHTKCNYTDKHFTHFLWLDSDHVFNPDLACYLARCFMRDDVDIISALYFGRTGQPLPVAYVKDETPDIYKHYPLIGVPNALIEVDAIGFGACMTKRDMFVNIPEPWFTLDWQAGEDIAFCVKAKQMGYRIWLDGSYKLGHIGSPPIITEADYDRHIAENEHVYAEKVKIAFENGRKIA